MHKAILSIAAAAAALASSGCLKGAEAADPKQISDSIKAQEAQWQADYAAKDINALAGHYSQDAALGGPGDPLATTDVDRRKALQGLLTDPNLKLTFAADRIQVAAAVCLPQTTRPARRAEDRVPSCHHCRDQG